MSSRWARTRAFRAPGPVRPFPSSPGGREEAFDRFDALRPRGEGETVLGRGDEGTGNGTHDGFEPAAVLNRERRPGLREFDLAQGLPLILHHDGVAPVTASRRYRTDI